MTPLAPPNFNPPYWDPEAARPRFAMGKKVRVKRGTPPGHVRTPWYCRGKTGVIERIAGHFADPQELAYHRGGLPKLPLYRVRFALQDLWGPEAGFAEIDTIDIEIFEPWLEPFWDYAGDFDAQGALLERELRDAP
ncbi:MAG: SH3-like domain-containing protein [Pseudomonadota bacterium]